MEKPIAHNFTEEEAKAYKTFKKDEKLFYETVPAYIQKLMLREKKMVEHWREIEDLTKIPSTDKDFFKYLYEKTNECEDCALCATRTMVVQPDGYLGAEILVVGEGPGFLEDLSGIPLVGPKELVNSRCNSCTKGTKCFAHRLLKSPDEWGRRAKHITCSRVPSLAASLPKEGFYLKSAGSIVDGILLNLFGTTMPRQNWINSWKVANPDYCGVGVSPWFFTNSVLCRSFDPIRLQDTTPESVPRRSCRKWLLSHWSLLNPKCIVCLGRPALESFLGSESAASAIAPGQVIQTKFGTIFFQTHPAAVMRENNKEAQAYGYSKIAETFRQAANFAGYTY